MHSVVALLGPRQCGKTTIANLHSDKIKEQNMPVKIFDLEDPQSIKAIRKSETGTRIITRPYSY